MNARWVKILLVASLALNLAFGLSLIFNKDGAKGHNPKPPWKKRIDRNQNFRGSEEIKLRDKQKDDIRAIFKSFRRDRLEYKQSILDKRIAIVEAMSDAEFNPEEIQKLTEELNEVENKLNVLFVDALLQINNLLDADQRLNFLLRLSRGWFFLKTPGPPSGHGNGKRRFP